MTGYWIKVVAVNALKSIWYSLVGMLFFVAACSISWIIVGCLRMACNGQLPVFDVLAVAIAGAKISLLIHGVPVFAFTFLYTCYYLARKQREF